MKPVNPQFPRIDPLPEGVNRPFWSVMVPTHNRTKYLEASLRSILDQAPEPDEMQIEVVDDCSTEGSPEAVVANVGKGRVAFFRQPQNVGMAGNWNTCLSRARGHWVHIMHDDDVLLPGFYAAYQAFIAAHPQVVLVSCRTITINENDDWLEIVEGEAKTIVLENALRDFVVSNRVMCATAVVSRNAYEAVGGFTPVLKSTLDWEMWIRLVTLGPAGHIGRPYLLCRTHAGSATTKLVEEGEMIRESVVVIEMGAQRLPPELRNKTRRRAFRKYAGDANHNRCLLQADHKYRGALRNALWACRLHFSIRHLRGLVSCVVRGAAYTCLKPVVDLIRRHGAQEA